MALKFRTGRGLYRLAPVAAPEAAGDSIVLTLALERADGIERVVFRCRIGRALVDHEPGADPDVPDRADSRDEPIVQDDLITRIAPWVEREFEATREAALKSIRSEHRLYEVVFDATNRGPF
jgi:hypothetical protein